MSSNKRHDTSLTEMDVTMMSFCIWRGIHETSKEADEISGEVDNPLPQDLGFVRIALAMVKPEYHDIMKKTLAITVNDIREGRI